MFPQPMNISSELKFDPISNGWGHKWCPPRLCHRPNTVCRLRKWPTRPLVSRHPPLCRMPHTHRPPKPPCYSPKLPKKQRQLVQRLEAGPQLHQKRAPSHWLLPHFVTCILPAHNPPNNQTLPSVATTKGLWIVLNTRLSAEDNVVSATNKAHTMLLYLERSFAALNLSIFLPLYKTFIPPHLEYAIQATHPILGCDAEALGKVQKLNLKFVKGLRHVP